jgi:hypothetical protein
MYDNTGSGGLDFTSFSNKMVEICNEHKKANRALAFAFILCDFDNPQIWKILNDREYWLALNEISGKYLSVFSFNYKSPQKKTRDVFVMNYLTNITADQNPRQATNILIQKYFKETEVNYPALLFFQVDNNIVIDSLLVDLKEQEIEKAFLELKNYLNRAAFALRRITPENKQNVKEIFNCLEEEVKSLRTARKVKRATQNLFDITGLLSSIRGIL